MKTKLPMFILALILTAALCACSTDIPHENTVSTPSQTTNTSASQDLPSDDQTLPAISTEPAETLSNEPQTSMSALPYTCMTPSDTTFETPPAPTTVITEPTSTNLAPSTIVPDPTTTTPEPTSVTPEPTVTPRAPLHLSGSAASLTGKLINVVLEYTVNENEEGNFAVHVDAYLDHYNLYCGKRTTSNNITIGDEVFPYSTPSFNFENKKSHTLLSSADYVYSPETLPSELKISARWLFNGSYSGQQIGLIEAETTIDLSAYAQ